MITILDLRQEPQHLKTLAQWHHNEWAHYNPGENLQQRIERMQTYLNDAFIPSTFIAKDNKLVGSAAIVAHDMETRPELSPWLASVYIEPESRCRGTGTQLVQHVMEKAKNCGIKTLYLFTPDKEVFYEKLGWEIICKEPYHGYPVSIMRVRLNNIKQLSSNH